MASGARVSCVFTCPAPPPGVQAARFGRAGAGSSALRPAAWWPHKVLAESVNNYAECSWITVLRRLVH
eukprot:9027711-Pyramimonas_sp.AAC.1